MARKNTLAHRLNRRVIVQVKTDTRGATGEVTETWATHLTLNASVEPLIGREYFQAMQEQSENKVKFRVRYSSNVALLNAREHRISYNSNIYDIESVINPFEENREIVIYTSLLNE